MFLAVVLFKLEKAVDICNLLRISADFLFQYRGELLNLGLLRFI